MRALSVMTLLAALVLPTIAFAEIQTFTAMHTYILGDHDSKDDARQRCLLEAKRKILEQAGVYIESASEVLNFDLTKDTITSFAVAVMQIKDTKENFVFENRHMMLTLTLTATVDIAEVQKLLAARQVDKTVRDTVATQQERLKRLEAQLEEMQQAPGRTPAPPPSNISSEDLQTLLAWAVQGNAKAQVELGYRYDVGKGVPQDYAVAREWYEKAAAQGNMWAQYNLGLLYANGQGVPQDYATARGWYEKAAAQGNALAQTNLGLLYANGQGVPQDYGKARQWWEKAAAQGNAMAQYNLGVLHAKGQGVPQDYRTARGWYEKAAAQGYAEAQLRLGALYLMGYGVPKDDVRAHMWFNLAAAHSTGDVQKSRSRQSR